MPTRRHFLLQAGAAAQTGRKPNVLVLAAPGWRAQSLPGEDAQVKAPAVARLAAEGVTFRRAYAAFPMRGPSLAALLTGKFPHALGTPRNGSRLDSAQPCIAALLAAAGYTTGYGGAWELDGGQSGGPARMGFVHSGEDAEGFATEFLAKRRDPWFLWITLKAPETPSFRPFRPEQFTLRDNVPLRKEAEARRAMAEAYARYALIDASVARILGQLKGDEVTVFTSDRGDLLGSHGLEGDGEPLEESARIPIIVRKPSRIKPGSTLDALTSGVDLAPTLLGLCGVPGGQAMQGRDLSSLLGGSDAARPESIYAEGKLGMPGEWRMIVRGFDKLVVNRQGEAIHLYNLSADPFEQSNQAESRAERRRQDELTALLNDWRRRTLDGRSGSGLRTRE